MCSRCPESCGHRPRWRLLAAGCVALLVTLVAAAAPTRVLRVAADPNNLPFSNDRLEGFENKIVAVVARELGATVEYTWHAQRRGFFRETLKQGNCDLVAGVPRGFDPLLTTKPYYRSTYVLVARPGAAADVQSLDDPRLRDLKIGVQMIGDDFANTPPAHALSRRGFVDNIRGFTLYGDYSEEAPPARIVRAVADGEVDVALVWGPLAGYFAARANRPLTVTPLPAFDEPSAQPFAFSIAMGVRRNEPALRDEINAVLGRVQPEIDAILAAYHVPCVPEKPAAAKTE
jgi:mxaJ protein